MSFSDVYANEVLQSRRTRSDRARFWAKVTSFLLMITVAVALRSEPELRIALMTAAMDGVSGAAASPTPTTPQIQTKNSVKVNRPGFGHVPSARFNAQQQQQQQQQNTPTDTQATADQINRLLQSLSQKP